MQQEQQQRILGYFLEEAREHLNTIEQGLLNLQTTLEDSEMINEVFRAAHSIKGGAAMLGLSSIQHTSHRLEDCFKILKENPIQVDQKLESLLLDVCDTLKALIENLGNPFGLSEEKAQALMSKTEPVLKWLNDHIETLLKQGNSGVKNLNNLPTTHLQVETSVPPQKPPIVTKQHQDWKNFQAQVLEILREMLQQFKQTNLEISRKNLQKCCHQLSKIGRDLNLSNWCSLCESAALAISNPNNSYLTLAKIIITEIKQAQELVLKNKDAEIAISQQLETLCPRPQQSLLAFENTEIQEPLLTGTTELNVKPPASVNATNLTELIDKSRSLFNHRQSTLIHNHSEIGVSELNNLADLFADDTQELNDNWQQGEILGNVTNYQLGITKDNDSEELNINDDLDSLLFF
ncbi:MAG: Hpt domain-containing protein, partial [Aphanizomenon sp.]